MLRKKKNIPEYGVGDEVDDLFVVRFKKGPNDTKTGKYYFEMKLQDAKGETMLRYWSNKSKEEIMKKMEEFSEDCVVYVKGRMDTFNDKAYIGVNEGYGTVTALKEGEYDVTDFIRKSRREEKEMIEELDQAVEGVKNPEIKKVLDSFFKDKAFMEKFSKSPAAMYKHHGWIHGLMEHSLTVKRIVMDLAKTHESLDQDLLVAGALLHDVGKTRELVTTSQIKVSAEGNLLGHVYLGAQMLEEKMKELKTHEETRNKLVHIILSHHGKLEFGSPKIPAFAEAFAIYAADSMDSNTTILIDAKEGAVTDDEFHYLKDYGNIYLK